MFFGKSYKKFHSYAYKETFFKQHHSHFVYTVYYLSIQKAIATDVLIILYHMVLVYHVGILYQVGVPTVYCIMVVLLVVSPFHFLFFALFRFFAAKYLCFKKVYEDNTLRSLFGILFLVCSRKQGLIYTTVHAGNMSLYCLVHNCWPLESLFHVTQMKLEVSPFTGFQYSHL